MESQLILGDGDLTPSAKRTSQATFTMKQIAAELAESHDLPKKKTEAILSDLVTVTTRHLKKGDKIRLTGLFGTRTNPGANSRG